MPRDAAVVRAVERVAGLQSQDSRAAAIGLWTRLPGLRREQLADLLQRRVLVKGTLMRATQHLVSAADYLVLRPALQPTLTAWAESFARRNAPGVALADMAAVVRPWFAEPHSARELRAWLHELYPTADAEALSIAVRAHLPLLQVPVAGAPWGVPGNPKFVDAAVWLGRELSPTADMGALLTRYLTAFGPARVADAQRWAGVTRLSATAQELGPRLRRLRDARGRELLDLERESLPRAPSPAPQARRRPRSCPPGTTPCSPTSMPNGSCRRGFTRRSSKPAAHRPGGAARRIRGGHLGAGARAGGGDRGREAAGRVAGRSARGARPYGRAPRALRLTRRRRRRGALRRLASGRGTIDRAQHDRRLDLPLRDVPVAAQKTVLLGRIDETKAVALVKPDRPRGVGPGAHEQRPDRQTLQVRQKSPPTPPRCRPGST